MTEPSSTVWMQLKIKRLNELNLNSQKIIEEKENLIKAMDVQLKQAVKDVGILQDMNLRNQNIIEEKENLIKAMDVQLKQAVKDVGILQEINLNHQETLEERYNQIKQLHVMDMELRNLRPKLNAIPQRLLTRLGNLFHKAK